ncbi:MAG: hypothetical protein WBV73_02660 [Phormidium sp.]
MKANRRRKFWSFGKLRLSNFSALLSLLPLLIGGFLAVVTAGKAEARHTVRYSEECCVVAQVGANTVELAQFPGEFYGQFYRVYVPTYSDELLRLVRQEVTPSAYRTSISRRRPIIIVTESDLRTARRAVRELQNKGIPVEMEVLRSSRGLPPRVGYPADSAYIVVVNIGRRQNRARLLNRVRSVEPDARLERINGQTVILVEVQSPVEAQNLIDELEIRGLNARLLEVNSFRGIEPEISSNQNRFAGVELESEISNNVDRFTPVETQETAITSAPETSYKLVIPIGEDELAAIEAQVRQMAIDLGKDKEVLIEANANQSQLIIGPFNNLQAAQQWEGYLRDYGVMNAIIR